MSVSVCVPVYMPAFWSVCMPVPVSLLSSESVIECCAVAKADYEDSTKKLYGKNEEAGQTFNDKSADADAIGSQVRLHACVRVSFVWSQEVVKTLNVADAVSLRMHVSVDVFV